MMIESLETRRLFASTIGPNPSGQTPSDYANAIGIIFSGMTGPGSAISEGAAGGTFGADTSAVASNGRSRATP